VEHTPDKCEFLKVRASYDDLIDAQKKYNKDFVGIVTRTNDATAESREELSLKIVELQEHTQKKYSELETTIASLRDSIENLAECSKANKLEIQGLRQHLDNGYQKKLREAIEETQKKIQTESNKELIDNMIEMVRHVVVGKTDAAGRRTDYFWNWLIKITAVGGLVYMIVNQVIQATK